MLRVRPAQQRDIDDLMALSRKAGIGMTTVPKTDRGMSHRIYLSQEAFARKTALEKGETFFLVLEDDQSVIGMACIFTCLGAERPFYSYRLSHLSNQSPELDVRIDTDVLHLVNDFHGYTEIGTLFVDPDRRQSGVGRFLSFSRFMLMAANPGRFGNKVMAEIRGWTGQDDRFPFWEHVSQKFFHMDFVEADRRSVHDFRFIADLMPKYPIYTTLLHEEAQEIIGKPHDTSKAAMDLLLSQGFRYEGLIDIFDGGPSVSAEVGQVQMINNAHTRITTLGEPPEKGQKVLVSTNTLTEFACIQTVADGPSGESITLNQQMLDDLSINEGHTVLVSPLIGRKK